MRKKLTGKRLIAVFLAVLMALTCFTALPFAASAATPAISASGKYVFAYFTGNNTSEQKIRFAVSDDGYNFTAVNGNQPVAEQTTGTGCARDPYLFRGQDGYYGSNGYGRFPWLVGCERRYDRMAFCGSGKLVRGVSYLH